MNFYDIKLRESNSAFLARHITARLFDGKIVILTDTPKSMYASFRKQWNIQVSYKYIERSRTIDIAQIALIDEKIAKMKQMRFSYKDPLNSQDCDAVFAAPDDAIFHLELCNTLYIFCPITREDLDLYGALMQQDGDIIKISRIQGVRKDYVLSYVSNK